MADMLQSGLAWLHTQRAAHLSTDVAYTPKGSGAAATVAATVSQIRTEELDAAGFPISGTLMDFIIAAADLEAEPVPGDAITFGAREYLVAAIGAEPCWRWTDASRLAYRIHTKDNGVSA